MAYITGYVGTYTSPQRPGVYRFRLDTQTGALSGESCFYPARNTKYTACWGSRVACLGEGEGGAGLCLLDADRPDAPLLDALFPEQVTSCSLLHHQGLLYTANYHDGTVLLYRETEGTLELARRVEVASEAGCHQIIPHGRWVLIPCLELDLVRIFDTEKDWAVAGEIPFAPGTGPRHGVFSADHSRYFMNSERSNQVFSFAAEGPAFTLTDTKPILPDDFAGKGDTAALRLSTDGRFLYTTARGADLIAVFAVTGDGLELVQRTRSGGSSPWDLALVPGHPFALVSNRKSGEVVSFPIGPDGTLGEICGRVSIPEPVGISLLV